MTEETKSNTFTVPYKGRNIVCPGIGSNRIARFTTNDGVGLTVVKVLGLFDHPIKGLVMHVEADGSSFMACPGELYGSAMEALVGAKTEACRYEEHPDLETYIEMVDSILAKADSADA